MLQREETYRNENCEMVAYRDFQAELSLLELLGYGESLCVWTIEEDGQFVGATGAVCHM